MKKTEHRQRELTTFPPVVFLTHFSALVEYTSEDLFFSAGTMSTSSCNCPFFGSWYEKKKILWPDVVRDCCRRLPLVLGFCSIIIASWSKDRWCLFFFFSSGQLKNFPSARSPALHSILTFRAEQLQHRNERQNVVYHKVHRRQVEKSIRTRSCR